MESFGEKLASQVALETGGVLGAIGLVVNDTGKEDQ